MQRRPHSHSFRQAEGLWPRAVAPNSGPGRALSLSSDLFPVSRVIALRVDGDDHLRRDRASAGAAPIIDRVVAGRRHRNIVRIGVGAAIFPSAGQRTALVRLAAVQVGADRAGQTVSFRRSAQTRRRAPFQRECRTSLRRPLRALSGLAPGRAALRWRRKSRRRSRPERGRGAEARRRRARRRLRIGAASRARTFQPPCLSGARLTSREPVRQPNARAGRPAKKSIEVTPGAGDTHSRGVRNSKARTRWRGGAVREERHEDQFQHHKPGPRADIAPGAHSIGRSCGRRGGVAPVRRFRGGPRDDAQGRLHQPAYGRARRVRRD